MSEEFTKPSEDDRRDSIDSGVASMDTTLSSGSNTPRAFSPELSDADDGNSVLDSVEVNSAGIENMKVSGTDTKEVGKSDTKKASRTDTMKVSGADGGEETFSSRPVETANIRTTNNPGNRRFTAASPNVDSEIRIPRNQSYQINILVRTLHGKTISICISPDAYVKDLKKLIKEETRVHIDEYWLNYQGRNLEDNCKLSYYGIKDNSHVTMNGRLRGG